MADCISEQADKKQQRPQDHERGGTPNLLSGCGVDSGILHPVHQGLEGQRGHGDGGNEPGWLDKEANGPATPPSGGHDGMGISQSVGRKSWGPESGRPFDPDATSSQGNGVPNGPGNRFARIETPSGEGGDRRIESRCGTDAWGGAVIGRWQDGTARRFEPGILPLAYGVPGRVGQIRGYGNAIVPPLAAEFVRAAMDALEIFSGCDVVSRIKPVEDSDAD